MRIHFASPTPSTRPRQEAVVLLEPLVDPVVDRLRLPVGVAGADHEVVRVAQHLTHLEGDELSGLLVSGVAGDRFDEFLWGHALLSR
jgi:hypothetical protein